MGTMVAFPPMCTMAFFWNVFTAPPQYGRFEEANPFPAECPQTDLAFGLDAGEDPSLFDDTPAAPSPILAETGEEHELASTGKELAAPSVREAEPPVRLPLVVA